MQTVSAIHNPVQRPLKPMTLFAQRVMQTPADAVLFAGRVERQALERKQSSGRGWLGKLALGLGLASAFGVSAVSAQSPASASHGGATLSPVAASHLSANSSSAGNASHFLSLNTAELAQRNSLVPSIRQRVHRLGVTGKGVRVQFLDLPARQDGQWHGRDMVAIFKDLAPDAQVEMTALDGFMSKDASVFPKLEAKTLADDPKTFREYFLKASAAQVNLISAELEALATLPAAKRPHVVNLSLAINQKNVLDHLLYDLNRPEQDGLSWRMPYPNIRAEVMGKAALDMSNPELQKQRAALYVETLFKDDASEKGAFYQAVQRYQKATAELCRFGTLIVVAVGNDGENDASLLSSDIAPTPFRQNWLTQSQHVMVVGASSNGGTPEDAQDDAPLGMNSPGTMHLLMPGDYVLVRQGGKSDRVVAGSSCSAAMASACAALLRQGWEPTDKQTLANRLLGCGDAMTVAPRITDSVKSKPQVAMNFSPVRLATELSRESKSLTAYVR